MNCTTLLCRVTEFLFTNVVQNKFTYLVWAGTPELWLPIWAVAVQFLCLPVWGWIRPSVFRLGSRGASRGGGSRPLLDPSGAAQTLRQAAKAEHSQYRNGIG